MAYVKLDLNLEYDAFDIFRGIVTNKYVTGVIEHYRELEIKECGIITRKGVVVETKEGYYVGIIDNNNSAAYNLLAEQDLRAFCCMKDSMFYKRIVIDDNE